MKTLGLLVVGGAIVVMIVLGQNHEDGISGVWNDLIGTEEPHIAKIEVEYELDISTP
jgi:hypothetical protein